MEQKRQESLLCFEHLDRASPELWPERMPGLTDFNKMINVCTLFILITVYHFFDLTCMSQNDP